MPATALLKFTQGTHVGSNGRAFVADTSGPITINNANNVNVQSFRIELCYAPPTSVLAFVPGSRAPTILAEGNGIPTATFTPDVGIHGCYRIRLTTWVGVGRTGQSDVDIRNVAIPTPRQQFIKPPYQKFPDPLPLAGEGKPGEKPDELNFEDLRWGWSGPEYNAALPRPFRLMNALIEYVDSIISGGGGGGGTILPDGTYPGDMLYWTGSAWNKSTPGGDIHVTATPASTQVKRVSGDTNTVVYGVESLYMHQTQYDPIPFEGGTVMIGHAPDAPAAVTAITDMWVDGLSPLITSQDGGYLHWATNALVLGGNKTHIQFDTNKMTFVTYAAPVSGIFDFYDEAPPTAISNFTLDANVSSGLTPVFTAGSAADPTTATPPTGGWTNGSIYNYINGAASALYLRLNGAWVSLVTAARTITATLPLRIDGGGSANLSANRTLSLLPGSNGQVLTTAGTDVTWANPQGVPTGRTLNTTAPLRIDGGAYANLSADRTLAIAAGTEGQILTTVSGGVAWAPSAAAGTAYTWGADIASADNIAPTASAHRITGTTLIRNITPINASVAQELVLIFTDTAPEGFTSLSSNVVLPLLFTCRPLCLIKCSYSPATARWYLSEIPDFRQGMQYIAASGGAPWDNLVIGTGVTSLTDPLITDTVITGIDAAVVPRVYDYNARFIIFHRIGFTGTTCFKNNNAGSLVGNRLHTSTGADLYLYPGETALIMSNGGSGWDVMPICQQKVIGQMSGCGFNLTATTGADPNYSSAYNNIAYNLNIGINTANGLFTIQRSGVYSVRITLFGSSIAQSEFPTTLELKKNGTGIPYVNLSLTNLSSYANTKGQVEYILPLLVGDTLQLWAGSSSAANAWVTAGIHITVERVV